MFNWQNLLFCSVTIINIDASPAAIFASFNQPNQLEEQIGMDLVQQVEQFSNKYCVPVLPTELSTSILENLFVFIRALDTLPTIQVSTKIALCYLFNDNLDKIFDLLDCHIRKYGAYCLVIIADKLPTIFRNLFIKNSDFSNRKILTIAINNDQSLFLPDWFNNHWKKPFFQELLNLENNLTTKKRAYNNIEETLGEDFFKWVNTNKKNDSQNPIIAKLIKKFGIF